jgi:formylglycine-generating enzyme required for sulfatase activity
MVLRDCNKLLRVFTSDHLITYDCKAIRPSPDFMAPNQDVSLTADQDDLSYTLTALRSINRLMRLPGWDDVAKARNLQGLDSLAHQLLDVSWQCIAGIPKSTTAEIERSQASYPPEIEMTWIPAGSFLMGSPLEEGSDDNESPRHEVNLSSFMMSRTPITQAQWRAVAQLEPPRGQAWPDVLNPYPVAGLSNPDRFRGDDKPVVNVSWNEAMAFCYRLRVLTGKDYTLPSEAQWEYACRAGTTTPFAFGETLSSELANYDASVTCGNGPKGEYRQRTTPVGMFPANAWGLQDMHGNVWEWCLDHWHDSYEGAPSDGSAWLDGEGLDGEQSSNERLMRGGSWFSPFQFCRSACRNGSLPDDRSYLRGFRVCRPTYPR